MTRSIRTLVDRFYEIVNGDDGDFSEIFSEDFEFGIMPGFPYGGVYNGLPETNGFFEKLGMHFDFWAVHTNEFLAVDKHTIVVTGRYTSKSSETGKDVDMETVHIWKSNNDMLTSYKHYCDTALLSIAMDHNVPTR